MRTASIFILICICFSSCTSYITLYAEKNADSKTAVQSFVTPCCGRCGLRIITDNLVNEQQSLLINCKPEDEYSWYCTEMSIGTQKHIDVYKKKFVRQHSVYRPVYDTIELKKQYPGLKREFYFDSLMLTRPLIPLTATDSAFINRAMAFKSDAPCGSSHLQFIRGYIFVNSFDVKSKKEKDFRNPGK